MDFASRLKRECQTAWHTAYLDYDALTLCASPPEVGRLTKQAQDELESVPVYGTPGERQPLIARKGKRLEGIANGEIKFDDLFASEVERVDDFYLETREEAQRSWSRLKEQYEVFERQKAEQGDDDTLWRKFRRRTRTQVDIRDWRSVRDDLRMATFTAFRHFRLLEQFALLNEDGFRDAASTVQGGSRADLAQKALDRLDKAHFCRRKHLDEASEEIKENYTRLFAGGNRLKALRELYPRKTGASQHFALWRAGFEAGLGALLIAEGLRHSLKPSAQERIPNWDALLQVWSAVFLPIFLGMLLVIDLAIWQKNKIGYILIFKLNRRTHVGNLVFAEIPATGFLIFSVLFWASWQKGIENYVQPENLPAIFLGVLLVWLFLPLPILWSSARWWVLRSLGRMLTFGLVSIQFRDFFFADAGTSLFYSSMQLPLIICAYQKHWRGDDIKEVCSPEANLATPFLTIIPYLIRSAQSFRRYVDSGKKLQLANVLKGFVSCSYHCVDIAWKRNGAKRDGLFIAWLIVGTANALYTGLWDIIIDWNLQVWTKRWLNHQLLYPHFAYYIAILANMLLRFAFMLSLWEGCDKSIEGFLTAVLEVIRRIIWAAFRLESEESGNLDTYKAVDDMPLPYDVSDKGTKFFEPPAR